MKQTVNIRIGELTSKPKRKYTRRPKRSSQAEAENMYGGLSISTPSFSQQAYPMSYVPPVYTPPVRAEPSAPAPTGGASVSIEPPAIVRGRAIPTLTSTDEPLRIRVRDDPTPYAGAVSASFIPSEAPELVRRREPVSIVSEPSLTYSAPYKSSGSMGAGVGTALAKYGAAVMTTPIRVSGIVRPAEVLAGGAVMRAEPSVPPLVKPVLAKQRTQYRAPAATKSFQSYPFPAPSYGDSSLRTPRVSFEPTTVSLPTEQYPIESRVKPKSGSAEYQRLYRARKKAEKEAMNPPEARVVKLKPRRTTQARRGRYVSGTESEAP